MISTFVLAWRQLSQNGKRLLAAVTGVAFATVLMLVQIGLFRAAFASITKLYGSMRAEIILISPQYQSQMEPGSFPRHRVFQALAVPGVRNVAPLYVGQAGWRNPLNHRDRDIYIIGLPPHRRLFDLPGVDAASTLAIDSDAVLFDEASRPEYGPIAKLVRDSQPVVTEVGGKRISVRGLFRLGASFASDGTILTSQPNFFHMVPYRRADEVEFGMVFLQPGAQAKAVQAHLAAVLPDDVRVLTRYELVARERDYWNDSLPIGYVLNMNVALGLIVGTMIVYQILYTDVLDHLSEYATLKALGHRNRFLLEIVTNEALILSVLGFVPGYLVSLGVYALTRSMSFLPLEMTWQRAAGVYMLAVLMCVGGGAFAMRKVKTVDPAEMY